MGDDIVDRERFEEKSRTHALFFLAAFGFFLFGQNVDIPAGQHRAQTHILATAADSERQLLVRHHDVHAITVFIKHDLGNFGRG